jgi:gliding motility-associated-like protein
MALMAFVNTVAQVTSVDFDIDHPSGCLPALTVNFTNKSVGSGTLTYGWEFGNGNTSTLKDPQAIYSASGTFTVKLTVSDGTNSKSAQKTVTVFKSPVANFTADKVKACTPAEIKFTDGSTKGDANIIKWNWDFRGGFLVTDQNPIHTYSSANKYDVFLEVTDANNCKASVEKKAYIDIADKPTVGFMATPSSSCIVPVNVQFTNNTIGAGNLTFSWTFGDEGTSNLAAPSHNYTTFGNYTVGLTAYSDYGCSNSISMPTVNIGEVVASGTLKQGNKTILNNGIVCAGDLNYNSTSSGTSSYLWDFGDGSASNSASGIHSYFLAGNYKVMLIASPATSCADTFSWNITVEKPVADFSLTPDKSCMRSTTISLTNQSSNNITSYLWKFDDGSTSSLQNLSKVISQPVDKDQYVIHEMETHPIKLVVSTLNGCKDSLEKTFTVHQPTALFTPSVVKGCAPLTVNFTDVSISTDIITSKTWHWGEGSPQPTMVSPLSHIYNTPGSYNVKLVAVTASGCKDTSNVITINVGSTATPDFTIPATICNSSTFSLSYPSPIGSRFHYSVGGVGIPGCDNDASPSVYMKTAYGPLSVKLEVDYNGCISERTKTGVTNSGAVGSFSYAVNCSTPRSVSFTGVASGASSYLWDFGDGNTSTSLSPTHVFSIEKDYTVKFIAYGTCNDTTIRVVKVRNHQPTYTSKTEICADNQIYFNSKLSHTMHTSCSEKYLWDFGDSTLIRTSKDSVDHAFTRGGTFKVKLFAYYDDGCVDSVVNKTIRVYKPVPGFTVDKSVGCTPLSVIYTDTSTPDVHPIVSWNWDFDGTNKLTYTSKLNTVANTFFYPGEYSSNLSVLDNFGCSATFEKRIATANPIATFSAALQTICAGSEAIFNFNYTDPDSAIWNFGNGKIVRSTTNPTKFLYTDSGSFDVSLTLYKFGCSDNYSAQKYIQVQKADARYSVSDTAYNCYPKMIEFVHKAKANYIKSGTWHYGHNNNVSSSYNDSVKYSYSEPGTFLTSLDIETTFGCTDTFSRSIKITGPKGDFDVSPTEACMGTAITYTIKDTSNVFGFKWDLGDGNILTGNPITHRYSSIGRRIAKLVLYGDSGRCNPPPVLDSVYIYEVEARINIADTSVCEGTTIEFKNSSVGANSYTWDLGDGTVVNTETTTHTHKIGTFRIALMASGLHGCKDTAYQYIVISKIPELKLSNDTSICLGDSIPIWATSDKPILWSPSTGLNSVNLNNPTAKPQQSIYYTALAKDNNSNCSIKDSVYVFVQQVPKLNLVFRDSGDISGSYININEPLVEGRPVQVVDTSAENGFIYLWSPKELFSCSTCPIPVFKAWENTNFKVKVTDKYKCFSVDKDFAITTKPLEKSFDVPAAFTPGSGDENSVFMLRGYDIAEVLEFKIYNRWGNIVFSSTDQNKGWDGTYQGKIQPVDSYVYTIKVKNFKGNVITRKGTLLLLR